MEQIASLLEILDHQVAALDRALLRLTVVGRLARGADSHLVLATEELRDALDEVSCLEVARECEASLVASLWGLSSGASLRQLAAATPAPTRRALLRRHAALRQRAEEVERRRQDVRRLLQSRLDGTGGDR